MMRWSRLSLACKMSWLMAVSIAMLGSGGCGWVVSSVTCSDSSKSCWMTSVTPSPPSDPPGAWPVASVSWQIKKKKWLNQANVESNVLSTCLVCKIRDKPTFICLFVCLFVRKLEPCLVAAWATDSLASCYYRTKLMLTVIMMNKQGCCLSGSRRHTTQTKIMSNFQSSPN